MGFGLAAIQIILQIDKDVFMTGYWIAALIVLTGVMLANILYSVSYQRRMKQIASLLEAGKPQEYVAGVERLLEACRRYFEVTGRRISYEYALIDGVNDADWQADLLAKRLKGTGSHVNLIPLNHVEESPLKPSRRVAAFQKRLERQGVTVRRKLGGEIDASCGQLRRRRMQEEA